MKRIFFLACCISVGMLFIPGKNTFCQNEGVAINTNGNAPHPSAILDVQSTEKGMLIPKMTSGQRMLINAPAEGLLVYDTDTRSFWYLKNSTWTEIIYDGSGWTTLTTGGHRRSTVKATHGTATSVVTTRLFTGTSTSRTTVLVSIVFGIIRLFGNLTF